MTGNPGIRRIGQIAVTVRDVERARAFYGDVLGLEHLFDAPPKMSFFDCGGVRLLLGEPESPGGANASGTILYFDVADLRAAHEALVTRGVTFEAAPHKVADLGDRELWLAFLRDGEGNTVGLMSEVALPR
ncbi:MAG TPA: VOC family protein [Longimicrobiales bacterium]|nr:VOC family protein [Longimicrobiales bacterium]